MNNGGQQQTRRNDTLGSGGNGNYSQPRRPHYPNANMQNRDGGNRGYEIGGLGKETRLRLNHPAR